MQYDVVVIGAGSGGVRFARMAAQYGARVAIVEERYYGGTCVNVGCVPKKLYVYAAQFRDSFEDATGFGWSFPQPPTFDWETLKTQRAREITRLNAVYENLLDRHKVDRFWGKGVFEGPHRVRVGDQVLETKHVLIASGSWPHVPDIPGREHVLTSNAFFDLPRLPERCMVVGAGYIGVELAGILAGLGVEVSLAFRGEHILRGFDDEVRELLAQQMAARGIRLLPKHDPQAVHAVAPGFIIDFEGMASQTADVVLVATGRRPLTSGLNLSAAGVLCTDQGAIPVNRQYQTSVPHIYAIGDVIDRVALTPVALAEGMYVAQLLFGAREQGVTDVPEVDYMQIPTTVFSQPNLGTVGLTEQAAAERGPIAVYVSRFRPMKNTLSGRDEQSLCKLIVCERTQRVLGLHVLGADAGEIVQGFAVAINLGATLADLHRTVGIHPTLAEELVTMRVPVRRVDWSHVGEQT
ncbi:MAG: glutathione-disulfide reductase [Gammaproteobacteria bacterium]